MNTENNLDVWMKCWTDNKFPNNIKPTYSEWKRFWDWWYQKPFFHLEEAYRFYKRNEKMPNL